MAIARDGAGVNGSNTTGTTLTWAHTVNGPNPILWVAARVEGLGVTLTATYNGVAMLNPTNAIKVSVYYTTYTVYLFCLTGQTGTNNIVVTASASANIAGLSMAFSGAKQLAGQPDASGNAETFDSGGGPTEFAGTLTTVAADAWMAMLDMGFNGVAANASSGSTRDVSGNNGMGVFSQGPYATPGSNSIKATPAATFEVNAHVFASFAPDVPVGHPVMRRCAGIPGMIVPSFGRTW
jgi:hypothetical protein